jgi:hypothetical protein
MRFVAATFVVLGLFLLIGGLMGSGLERPAPPPPQPAAVRAPSHGPVDL